ncbi:hypothetical protein [Roseibium sp. LAB1]
MFVDIVVSELDIDEINRDRSTCVCLYESPRTIAGTAISVVFVNAAVIDPLQVAVINTHRMSKLPTIYKTREA